MSLILEALRRSEEERRRRTQPLLYAAPTRRRRGARRALLLIAIVLASALAGTLLWLHPARSPDAPAFRGESPSPSPAAASGPTPPATAGTPRAGSATIATDAIAPAATVPRREADPAELLREGAAIVAPASPDPLADPALDPATRQRLTEMLTPGSGHAPPPPATAEPVAMPSAPATAEPVAPAGPPRGEHTPAYEDLPYALRRELPSFRVSMIVAASDPAARFVLVAGERRREGEELAPGVLIAEIHAEGLVLEFRGQRFRWRQTR